MKKAILILMSFVMLMSFAGCGEERGVNDNNAYNSNMSVGATDDNTPKETSEIGSIIKFGRYEQDNNLSNGTEEIEWIVLEKEDNRMFVISKYALDSLQYNNNKNDVTWETCSLRVWLNDTFINTAFSSDEKNKILTVPVVAEDNYYYDSGQDAGADTNDKVFLLSISETEEYFKSDSDKRCYPTEYAVSQGAFKNPKYATCLWWLRSPGKSSGLAAKVDYALGTDIEGDLTYGNGFAVRPAMWIEN